LAQSYHNLGVLLATTGRPREAEAAYAEALALQKRVAADFTDVPGFQNDVAGTLGSLAELAQARRDWRQARVLLEEALPYHRRALKANAKHPAYRRFFHDNRSALALTLVRLGDHAAAAAAVEELTRFGDKPADDSYKASGFLCLCVSLAEKDAKLPAPRRKALADAYAARAVQLLGEAVAHGKKDVAKVKNDTDFDPLRARPDFQRLLAELEKKTPE
jgi:tetratricopeptide (TPR) repeat protein